MKRALFLFAALGYVSFSTQAVATIPHCAVLLSVRTPEILTEEIWKELHEFVATQRLVVSHGYLGEVNYTPFKFAMMAALGANPTSTSRVTEIHPSSLAGLDENARQLAARFRDLVAANPPGTRFLVVSFSYSGPIWLRVFARWPELIDSLEGFYAVQGPFGGSVLADHILYGHDQVSDSKIPHWMKWFLRASWETVRVASSLSNAALKDLSTSRMQAHTRWSLERIRESNVHDELSRRVFYVMGACEPDENVLFAVPEHRFQKLTYGLSDGVILLAHQYPSAAFLPDLAAPGGAALGRPLFFVEGASHQTLTDVDRGWCPRRGPLARDGVLAAILSHAQECQASRTER